MTIFSEKKLISTRCMYGFMSNLIKKSWRDSNIPSLNEGFVAGTACGLNTTLVPMNSFLFILIHLARNTLLWIWTPTVWGGQCTGQWFCTRYKDFIPDKLEICPLSTVLFSLVLLYWTARVWALTKKEVHNLDFSLTSRTYKCSSTQRELDQNVFFS